VAPATGTTSWTYAWIAHGNPSTVVKVRAVDDSGNLQTPGAAPRSRQLPVLAVGTSTRSRAPTSTPATDAGEVGSSSRPTASARHRRALLQGATNTGTHIGSLWSTDGRAWPGDLHRRDGLRMADVTFATPCRSPGPRTSRPTTPQRPLLGTANYLYRNPAPGPTAAARPTQPPLHAIRNTGTETNGVYTYSPPALPGQLVRRGQLLGRRGLLADPAPGQVTNVSAVAGGKTSANVTWSAPASGGP
jgi:hypothetical protein